MPAAIRTACLVFLSSLCISISAYVVSRNSTAPSNWGFKTACRDTGLWTTPQWSRSASYNCFRIIEALQRIEPEALLDDVPFQHQFLPLGIEPEYPAPESVRTPWKLTNGQLSLHVPNDMINVHHRISITKAFQSQRSMYDGGDDLGINSTRLFAN